MTGDIRYEVLEITDINPYALNSGKSVFAIQDWEFGF